MGYKRWMLVEGADDQHVFRNLLRQHHIPCAIPGRDDPIVADAIVIEEQGGVDSLLEALLVVLDDADLERLGIVVDADTDIEARWMSLCRIMADFGGVDIPPAPDPDGTIITLEQVLRTVTVGIWMMPDNTLPGILEDFIRFLVPGDDILLERAEKCVATIPEAERRFAEKDQPKACIHTWLAWREDPGTPLGWAITKRYLDANAPYAQRLVNWVNRAFDIR